MFRSQFRLSSVIALALMASLVTSSCARRKKYENPITKDTVQPDKVLFDKAMNDIEHGRYEVARIELQTLMNTYDTSEYLAKAKLAYADSWYREGGSHGWTQAEAEYKDFILFYPNMEEAPEAQEKVCMIHYKQMDKADRDPLHAEKAEEECRNLLVNFPNSKFAPQAKQLLRNIQEALAEHEYVAGAFYYAKKDNPAAANRFQGLVDQYPLYSKADDALWRLGDAYGRLGPRMRNQSAEAYSRLVKDYPLSGWADEAKKKLKSMEMPVPEADPVAYNRMKYEIENQGKASMVDQALGILKRGPDVHMAAKSGEPAMTTVRPSIPVTVPGATAAAGFNGDVTATTVGDGSALDTKPDARGATPAAGDAAKPASDQAAAPAAAAPQQQDQADSKAKKKKKKFLFL